jgi:hypothetical protein
VLTIFCSDLSANLVAPARPVQPPQAFPRKRPIVQAPNGNMAIFQPFRKAPPPVRLSCGPTAKPGSIQDCATAASDENVGTGGEESAAIPHRLT